MPFFRFVILAVCVSQFCSCYISRLAFHQNNLFNSRRDVQDVLADLTTPQIVRQRLHLSRKVLEFAEKSGLSARGAYRYYIETPGDAVSFIVQAAQRDGLEFKTWWFPVVGRVPYLGYFQQEERDAKARELVKKGFDVFETSASAFSSLGWFDDPLYSSMLMRSERGLVHLLLHELTHRTVWIPGSARFNENFAEYIATVLTKDFLQQTNRVEELRKYELQLEDRQRYQAWVKALEQELQKLYAQQGLHSEQLLKLKERIFEEYLERSPKFHVANYVGKRKWNNASVLAATLYAPQISRFEVASQCLGPVSLKTFFARLKQEAERTGGGFKALDALCAPSNDTLGSKVHDNIP